MYGHGQEAVEITRGVAGGFNISSVRPERMPEVNGQMEELASALKRLEHCC